MNTHTQTKQTADARQKRTEHVKTFDFEPGVKYATEQAAVKHTLDCASIANGVASKALGKYTDQKSVACYCDCGAENNAPPWRIWENIAEIEIFPVAADPDNLAFGRQLPICTINPKHPRAIENAKLIVHACNNIERITAQRDDLLAALKEVEKITHVSVSGTQVIAILSTIQGITRAAIAKAEGSGQQ